MASPRTFIIDFETYYSKEYNLRVKGMSYPDFILDKRFKVHGMAVDDGKSQYWFDAKRIPDVLNRMADDIIVAHNGFFDFGVLAWHYKFHPAYMLDTLLLANHVLGSSRDLGGESNDLGALASRLGLGEKGDAIELVKGVVEPDEAQIAALAAYAKQDVALTRKVLNHLLPQVSNTDFELWLLDHTLRIYTERQLPVNLEKIKSTRVLIQQRRTERLAAAGVPPEVLSSNKQFAEELGRRFVAVGLTRKITEDETAAWLAAQEKEATKRSRRKANPFIVPEEGDTITLPPPPERVAAIPMKTSPRTGKKAPALSKGDAAFLALVDHDNESISNLVRGRLVERSSTQALARLSTMEKYHKQGLGIPVHLIYYGAHTGRFAAGGGFNFQNLTNPDRATDAVDREIASAIRHAIEAVTGKVFVMVDAAQIEARVLAWLAGETQILEAFSTGADLYSDFISGVLGENIHKPTAADPPETHKHLKLMRHVGKEAVLGLGYSMGTDKFFLQLRNKNRDVAKLIDAGKLTLKQVGEIVAAYRDKYTMIVDYWKDLERAFHDARRGSTRRLGPLVFSKEGNKAVSITLPSGRKLYYRNIRAEEYTGHRQFTNFKGKRQNADPKRVEWKHGAGQKIYGGLLAENITQAVSRDILAEGIHAAETNDYPVAMHVHDEIVCMVDEAKGQECHDFLVKTLSTPPAWGAGLVLGAEGRVGKTLGK